MSLTSTILKAGAMYALGRAAQNINRDDVEKVAGLSGDDLRRYGFDRLDAALHTVGLQRESTIPSSTAMILSGFAAGAIVGAGVTFLFYTDQGEAVRAKIGEFFGGRAEGEVAAATDAETNGANGATVNA